MLKLEKKQYTVLISSVALSSLLTGCVPAKTNDINEQKSVIQKQIINTVVDKTGQTIESAKNTIEDAIEEEKQKESDKKINDFINNLKEELSELKQTAKDKWNSDEVQEKVKTVKQKFKDLFDFVFNGKEINGVTFKELSQNGKEIAKNGFYDIKEYIETGNLYDLLVDQGANLWDAYDSFEQLIGDYIDDVAEEHNSRKR